MKIKRIYLILLLLTSCGNVKIENNLVEEQSVKTIHLDTEELNFQDLGLMPKGCCFVDSFFVVYNAKVDDKIISVYKNQKIVTEFGRLGNGHNDLLYPMFIAKGHSLKRFMPLKTGSEYRLYDFSSIVDVEKNYESSELPEIAMITNNVLINNDTLTVLTASTDTQLYFYNKTTLAEKKKSYFDDKFLGDKASDDAYNMTIYRAVYSCNGKYIIAAYTHFKMIDIISLEGELIKRIVFEGYDINKPKFYVSDDNGNVRYADDTVKFFTSIIISDDCFYLVCQNNSEPNTTSCITKTLLYKFDYTGSLLTKYQFDNTMTFGAVQGNDLFIIGYKEIDEPKIYHAVL
jgi:hypothetical protein